jgi:hypothetical protein
MPVVLHGLWATWKVDVFYNSHTIGNALLPRKGRAIGQRIHTITFEDSDNPIGGLLPSE